MSDTHLSEVNEADSPVVPLETGGRATDLTKEPSIVDLLKQDMQELAAIEEVHIPVAGYERTKLTVKYHLPESGKELDHIQRKVMQDVRDNYMRNLYTGMDMMIHLCSGLYVQPDGVDEPVELDPELIGEPVKFDERLAQVLGMTPETSGRARAVVRKLFDNNDMAIIAHAEKLNRWLQNTKTDINLEFWQLGG